MISLETGMLARSLAGHDRGKLYIIIRVEKEYVWIADGLCHTLEKPKKKNKKHIQAIHRIPDPVKKILESGKPLCDEHIIQAIQSETSWQEDKDV